MPFIKNNNVNASSFAAAADSNADLNKKIIQNQSKIFFKNFEFHKLLTKPTKFAICLILILSVFAMVQVVKTAAVYSNVDFFTKINFEPLCTSKQEHFVESDGKESSLILEFNSGNNYQEKRKTCTRILSAPKGYGFIVRLILPKIRRGNQNYHTAAASSASSGATMSVALPQALPAAPQNMLTRNMKPAAAFKLQQPQHQQQQQQPTAFNEMTTLIEKLNTTALKSVIGRSCPLAIFSFLDPHTPQWRLDPCQLEDTAPEMEDPVRLFHGRIRIVWEHGFQPLHSKLMVTALGKGEQCRSVNKHQCLKIGDEPILCISNQLVCDGIRHCPYSPEYDSDEDYGMCWKRRHFGGGEVMPPAMESDIFEHFALEVFRNLFAFDAPTMSKENASKSTASFGTSLNGASPAITTLKKVENGDDDGLLLTAAGGNKRVNGTFGKSENGTDSSTSNGGIMAGMSGTTHGRRNSTRNGLGSDFSKYGPWGYLMLGMLLCGGALLICGLWASASQHAANNEREAALQNGAAGFNSSMDHQSSCVASPPNYEELEPPPAYSVLFPNQKAASSTTLSSLAVPVTAVLPTTATITTTTTNCSTNTTATTPTTATSATTTTDAGHCSTEVTTTTTTTTTTTRTTTTATSPPPMPQSAILMRSSTSSLTTADGAAAAGAAVATGSSSQQQQQNQRSS